MKSITIFYIGSALLSLALSGCSATQGKMVNEHEVSYSFKKNIFDDIRSTTGPNTQLEFNKFDQMLAKMFQKHKILKEELDEKKRIKLEAQKSVTHTNIQNSYLSKYKL